MIILRQAATIIIVLSGLLFSLFSRAERDGNVMQLIARTSVQLPSTAQKGIITALPPSQLSLRIAVWGPPHPPVYQELQPGKFEGIAADNIALIAQLLSVRVDVIHYQNIAEAKKALAAGKVDLLAFYNTSDDSKDGLISSYPWLLDHNVLLQRHPRKQNASRHGSPGRLGWVGEAAQEEVLKLAYPEASRSHFALLSQAVSALRYGQIDALWINAASADFIRNQEPNGQWQQRPVPLSTNANLAFATLPEKVGLLAAINEAMAALPVSSRLRILANWGVDRLYLSQPTMLALSQNEKEWIHQHSGVRIIQPQLMPPFNFSEEGRHEGFLWSVLGLIADRTGLTFITDSSDDKSPTVDLTGASLLSEEEARLSRPYAMSPWVVVVRDRFQLNSLEGESGSQPVLIPAEKDLAKQLRQRYPDKNIVEQPSFYTALDALSAGRAFASVMPQAIAEFLLDKTVYADLVIAETLDLPPARIGFRLNGVDPVLAGILVKALIDISPQVLQRELMPWLQYRTAAHPGFWQTWRDPLLKGTAGLLTLALLFFLRACHLNRITTQRKQYEQQLEDKLRFINTLIDESPVALYVRDLQLRMVHCNHTYLQFLGIHASEVAGKTLDETTIGTPEFTKHLLNHYQRILQHDESQIVTEELEVKGERRLIYHWTLPYHDHRGQLNGIIGGFLDVTERETLLKALQEAKQVADAANASKSLFLAQMSHEIRTPMNALVGLLELENRATSTPEQRKQNLKVAWQASQTLLELVGDILDLAKIEAGKVEVHLAPVALADVLKTIHTLFSTSASQKRIDFTLTVDLQHHHVLFDPTLFYQIVSNLVSNAIKFTSQGSVELAISEYAEADEAASCFIVEVSDSGCGMNSAQQHAVFEPFVQVEDALSLGQGTGLGLSICRQLAAMVNGTLNVESEPGKGTTFLFSFSAIPCAPERLPQQAASVCKEPKKILIVDDHSPNRLLLAQQIAFAGHVAVPAKDAQQAIEKWENTERPFDMVITDCNMPGMDGFTLVALLRAKEREGGLSPCPMYGLTALSAQEVARRSVACGMTDCLFKPIRVDALIACLNDTPCQLPRPSAEANTRALNKLTHGNPEAMRDLAETLLSTNQKDFDALQQALERRDFIRIAELAHRLAGSARLLDHALLSDCCKLLEKEAKEHQLEKCRHAVLVCEQLLLTLHQELITLTEKSGETCSHVIDSDESCSEIRHSQKD